jgi:flagellar motor switch protein FliM
MKVGDILYFNKPEHASVEISGARVFTAEIGSLGNNAAVQVKKFVQTPTSNQ